MAYKVKKLISQYALVDLLEILLNKNHLEYSKAKEELEKRKPSEKEFSQAKKDLEVRIKLNNKPLSLKDKINCFIIPYTAPQNSTIPDSDEISDAYADHLDKFKSFGESRRYTELLKWQKYARRIYLSIGITGLVMYIIAKLLL